MSPKRSFVDSRSRIAALVIFVLCIAALGYIHGGDLFADPQQDAAADLNPEFVECRDKRVGHVTKMLADRVIDQVRHDQFVERAIAFCASKFPPGGAAN